MGRERFRPRRPERISAGVRESIVESTVCRLGPGHSCSGGPRKRRPNGGAQALRETKTTKKTLKAVDRGDDTCYNGHVAMDQRARHTRQRYEARARIAKALAHPSRLLMLEAMEEKERCVCELTELVGADQSTVSKHLAVLKQAGLVEDRKEGVMVYYRVKVCCLGGFWDCMEGVLAENLKAQQAALR